MIKTEDLRTAVVEALKYIKKQKDVIDAEVFASWNDLITIRLNYTSDIPCNGIHEPKSIQSYGLGILATFKRGNRVEVGFGAVTNDLTKEGILDALEKANRNRVYDPDFKTLPEPVDKPALTNYHDKRVMEVSGKETVNLGWKALDGALKTLHDCGHKKTIIIC